MLKADGAGRNNHVARADVEIDAAAGADTDKRIRADVVQLLHRDGGRRPADARRADGHLLAEECAGIDGVFAVLRDKMRVVKMGGDGLAAAGIARQDAIPAHIALHAVDMELFVQLLHKIVSFKSGSTRERRRI